MQAELTTNANLLLLEEGKVPRRGDVRISVVAWDPAALDQEEAAKGAEADAATLETEELEDLLAKRIREGCLVQLPDIESYEDCPWVKFRLEVCGFPNDTR